MRAVLQRVTRASVEVGGSPWTETGAGLVVLLAVEKGDTLREADWMARKIAELRIFEDVPERHEGTPAGKMNRSVTDVGGAVLLVSQFTLAADCRKGRRPSFDAAAPPEEAKPIIARVRESLEAGGLAVGEGAFGRHMKLLLVNDGPVTIVLERRAL